MSGEERRETDAQADPDRGGSGTAAHRTDADEAASTPPNAPALMPLDRVLDGDADPEDRNVAVVVEHARAPADEHRIDTIDGSPTVAALNPEHPPDANVVVVAFEADLDRDASGWRSVPRGDLADRLAGTAVSAYAYPVTRLETAELATDGGKEIHRGKLMHPAGARKPKARRTPLRKERLGTPLPSTTTGINASPSSSDAADRRRAWLRGRERPDHERYDHGGVMNTTSHPDPEANSDDHDHDHRLVTDGGTALDAGVDPDATVAAELHYTAFADTDVFVALVQRHGLDYAGTTNDHLPGPGATPFVWGKNHGTDEQVLLATGCHPVTGEFHAGGYREEGYASYLYLAGPAYAAEPLYQDVHETAEYMKGEFQPLAPVEGDGDADERVQESTIMTDGGARTASADTDGGSTTTNPDADPTEFGVLPETHHDVERVASERGAYLAATTDLDRRQGRSVGYLELGFSDAGAARKIGVAPTTVSGWISRTVAQYGPRVGFPTPASERGDLVEVTRERVLDLPHAEREQFREAAVENPGVVPGEVLAVLSDGAGGDGGEHR